jgi:hypothetical protein
LSSKFLLRNDGKHVVVGSQMRLFVAKVNVKRMQELGRAFLQLLPVRY